MSLATRYLLIGGGLASHQAARAIRERDTEGSILLVGEEPYVPYDRPPLSKEFLRGEKEQGMLFFDPASFFQEQRIELRLGASVTGLDASAKAARLSNGDTVTFEKAFVGTGGRPVRLDLPGSELTGVHYLRTIDDSLAIAKAGRSGSRVVIVGAGFIGLEVAASLTQRGAAVTVVEMQSRIWPRFADPTLAGVFQRYCENNGVAFRLGQAVTEIRGTGRVSSVLLRSGEEVACDAVCIGVGIAPNTDLAQQAGLQIENGIVVNEYLQTSHPDIYAGGDVANYPDPYFRRRRRVEHWGHAEYCGQLAGGNMAGGADPYQMLTYVWSDIFDHHLEFAGDEETYDRVLVRGSLEETSFMVLYVKDNVLRAYCAVNAGAKEFPALQRMIKQGKDVSGKESQLQDSAVPVKSLA